MLSLKEKTIQRCLFSSTFKLPAKVLNWKSFMTDRLDIIVYEFTKCLIEFSCHYILRGQYFIRTCDYEVLSKSSPLTCNLFMQGGHRAQIWSNTGVVEGRKIIIGLCPWPQRPKGINRIGAPRRFKTTDHTVSE